VAVTDRGAECAADSANLFGAPTLVLSSITSTQRGITP